MTVLVTGAAGYIGSHVSLALIEAGHTVVALDNLCNSGRESLEAVYELTGQPIKFYECDVRDGNSLMDITVANKVEAVIHLAGLKAVAESVYQPLEYYENNVGGAITLLRVMSLCGVRRLVFSSSATVYGVSPALPAAEDAPLSASNPYGRTKLVVEGLIGDAQRAGLVDAALLRYFNPIGSHPSGKLGENPRGEPANIMPHICRAAAGEETLKIFGTDYPTPDGTCVRDYIHVCDLAEGHIAALTRSGTYNLGGGRGVSVKELVAAFEQVNRLRLSTEEAPRREGDAPASWADITLAERELGWKPLRDTEDMCRDAWRSYLHQKEKNR